MKPSLISRSWQQLTLTLFLCAACLISCIHALHFFSRSDGDVNYGLIRHRLAERDCRRYCYTTFDPVSCKRCRNGIEPQITGKRTNLIARSTSNLQDNSMCGCCIHSRLQQAYCCARCSEANRYG